VLKYTSCRDYALKIRLSRK